MKPTTSPALTRLPSLAAGEYRRAEGREDVVAVVPVAGHVAAEAPEGVGEVVWPVDREDVAARSQRGLEPERDLERLSEALRVPGLRRRRLGLGLLRLHRCLARSGRQDRRRRPGLSPRLGIADEDLATRRKPAVIGRQVDVEAGYVAAVARCLAGSPNLGLLERDRVAPITERHPSIGPRSLRDAADREPGNGSAREASSRALTARRCVGVAGDIRRGDLTAEERERADRARSDRARVRPDIGRSRDRYRTGRQHRAVTRIGEA